MESFFSKLNIIKKTIILLNQKTHELKETNRDLALKETAWSDEKEKINVRMRQKDLENEELKRSLSQILMKVFKMNVIF